MTEKFPLKSLTDHMASPADRRKVLTTGARFVVGKALNFPVPLDFMARIGVGEIQAAATRDPRLLASSSDLDAHASLALTTSGQEELTINLGGDGGTGDYQPLEFDLDDQADALPSSEVPLPSEILEVNRILEGLNNGEIYTPGEIGHALMGVIRLDGATEIMVGDKDGVVVQAEPAVDRDESVIDTYYEYPIGDPDNALICLDFYPNTTEDPWVSFELVNGTLRHGYINVIRDDIGDDTQKAIERIIQLQADEQFDVRAWLEAMRDKVLGEGDYLTVLNDRLDIDGFARRAESLAQTFRVRSERSELLDTIEPEAIQQPANYLTQEASLREVKIDEFEDGTDHGLASQVPGDIVDVLSKNTDGLDPKLVQFARQHMVNALSAYSEMKASLPERVSSQPQAEDISQKLDATVRQPELEMTSVTNIFDAADKGVQIFRGSGSVIGGLLQAGSAILSVREIRSTVPEGVTQFLDTVQRLTSPDIDEADLTDFWLEQVESGDVREGQSGIPLALPEVSGELLIDPATDSSDKEN